MPTGRFVDVTDESGPGLSVEQSSRGTGLDDLDNDGDIDLVVLNSATAPTILRNDVRSDHSWTELELIGTESNRDGAGARVGVTAGGKMQWAEVHLGRGYQSHHGKRLHFGLEQASSIENVKIQWPSGDTDSHYDLPVNRIVQLVQGVEQPRVLESLSKGGSTR
jgi:hypothetical protein